MKFDKVKLQAEADQAMARAGDIDVMDSEIVRGTSKNMPTSIRLSAPLVKALDAIAAQQQRTRGNLIQHILWDYVRNGSAPGTRSLSQTVPFDGYGIALMTIADTLYGESHEHTRNSAEPGTSASTSSALNSSALAAA